MSYYVEATVNLYDVRPGTESVFGPFQDREQAETCVLSLVVRPGCTKAIITDAATFGDKYRKHLADLQGETDQ